VSSKASEKRRPGRLTIEVCMCEEAVEALQNSQRAGFFEVKNSRNSNWSSSCSPAHLRQITIRLDCLFLVECAHARALNFDPSVLFGSKTRVVVEPMVCGVFAAF